MTRTTTQLTTLAGALLALSACGTPGDSVRDKDGTITEKNDKASVFTMRLGDCYNDPNAIGTGEEAEEVESLPAIPCKDAHQFEVYAIDDLNGEKYPGQATVEKQADTFCTSEFETFIGTSYDDSALDFTYLYPTDMTWAGGDREITCLVGDPEKDTTGSLEGAKR